MQHLAGNDIEQQEESSSGPDLDPNKRTIQINNTKKHRKGEKVKGIQLRS